MARGNGRVAHLGGKYAELVLKRSGRDTVEQALRPNQIASGVTGPSDLEVHPGTGDEHVCGAVAKAMSQGSTVGVRQRCKRLVVFEADPLEPSPRSKRHDQRFDLTGTACCNHCRGGDLGAIGIGATGVPGQKRTYQQAIVQLVLFDCGAPTGVVIL
jgi:hypothetical protein